ncbi:alpha/beta hydrolase [Spiractinospora alimapuensis]|uniref:alpha/beta fold hydrolase n=1 Tax=Spiractinospora alimapuensis TaxID=2820884 RepID=UPI001F1EECF0|nr:alpha/beta hydrolase [Spiractinospora alimapuensis]QVQ53627.1 alpha/beta hydrolase [Spiractinospora alimapuensis]
MSEGRIHYRIQGESGSPVVLLHGAGIDNGAWIWRWLAPELAATHRVYVPDHPKHGQSWPWRARADQRGQEEVLARLLDHWELERATLVGLSLGSTTAIGYTLRHPDRVRSLVLTSCGGIQDRVPRHGLSYLALRTPLSWSVSRAMSPEALRRWVRREVRFADYVPEEDIDALADLAGEELERKRSHGGHMFSDWNRYEIGPRRMRVDFRGRLSEITCPVLLVHGELDEAVPLRYPREAADIAPQGRLEVIEGAGHFVPVERPREYSHVVRAFLDRDTGSAAAER